MDTSNQPLRFAILCRVSTENQEKGESIARQEKSLKAHVKRLGGTIPVQGEKQMRVRGLW